MALLVEFNDDARKELHEVLEQLNIETINFLRERAANGELIGDLYFRPEIGCGCFYGTIAGIKILGFGTREDWANFDHDLASEIQDSAPEYRETLLVHHYSNISPLEKFLHKNSFNTGNGPLLKYVNSKMYYPESQDEASRVIAQEIEIWLNSQQENQ